jgi:hypothetical protein
MAAGTPNVDEGFIDGEYLGAGRVFCQFADGVDRCVALVSHSARRTSSRSGSSSFDGGAETAAWPAQHPGVALDTVPWVVHAACLRCHWFDPNRHSMERPDRLEEALVLARRHQTSDGIFLDRAIRVVTNTSESGTPQDDS